MEARHSELERLQQRRERENQEGAHLVAMLRADVSLSLGERSVAAPLSHGTHAARPRFAKPSRFARFRSWLPQGGACPACPGRGCAGAPCVSQGFCVLPVWPPASLEQFGVSSAPAVGADADEHLLACAAQGPRPGPSLLPLGWSLLVS